MSSWFFFPTDFYNLLCPVTVYYYEFATSFCREISEEISKHLRSESTKNRPLPAPPVPPKASRNITKPIPEERLDSSDAETDEPPPPPPCVRPKFSRSQSQDNLCAITKMNNVSAKRSIMDILDAHSSDIYYNCKNLMEIIKADANRKRKRKNHTDGIIYWIKQCHRDQKFRYMKRCICDSGKNSGILNECCT